jgi:2-amino-4-hydroxy-6-hydroxymethyldihydropteridine diphosphokinase
MAAAVPGSEASGADAQRAGPPGLRAYVGLGANLGDPRRTLALALQALAAARGVRVQRVSSLYRSAPIDASGPDFINAVAEVDTDLPAQALLETLQAIEQQHGRERPYRNAPRTLDLDLLVYGDQTIATPVLTVPHPRMHERAFVLRPLAELAPALAIPGRGVVAELLLRCDDQRIERL